MKEIVTGILMLAVPPLALALSGWMAYKHFWQPMVKTMEHGRYSPVVADGVIVGVVDNGSHRPLDSTDLLI